MSRLQITSYRPRRHFFEHLLEASEELANVWLRRRVTIPAELELSGRANSLIDSAERLPSVTCAFKGCTGCEQPTKKFIASSRYQTDCPSDRQLRAHILAKRSAQIGSIANIDESKFWDVYKQALAVRERQSIPVVGAAVDRRAFEHTLQVYNDDCVRSLICFVCARICLDSGCARSHIRYYDGAWLLQLPKGSPKKNFSKAVFEERSINTVVHWPFVDTLSRTSISATGSYDGTPT